MKDRDEMEELKEAENLRPQCKSDLPERRSQKGGLGRKPLRPTANLQRPYVDIKVLRVRYLYESHGADVAWLSIPAVLSYWLEAAQDEHGLDGNIVLDLESMAAGVCLAHYICIHEGSLEGLSSALTGLACHARGRCCLFLLLDFTGHSHHSWKSHCKTIFPFMTRK